MAEKEQQSGTAGAAPGREHQEATSLCQGAAPRDQAPGSMVKLRIACFRFDVPKFPENICVRQILGLLRECWGMQLKPLVAVGCV